MTKIKYLKAKHAYNPSQHSGGKAGGLGDQAV